MSLVGLAGFQASLKQALGASRLNGLQALEKSLLLIEAEAKRLIKSGYYQPAIDTGRMIGSITYEINVAGLTELEGRVGTNVEYAIYVHNGTARMKARPFLLDAVANKQEQIVDIFNKVI